MTIDAIRLGLSICLTPVVIAVLFVAPIVAILGLRVRQLRRFPVVRLADARPGQEVAVEGRIGGVEERAPLSLEPCVLWHIHVAQGTWPRVTAFTRVSERPLVLDDGTGGVVVEPAGADVHVIDQEVTDLVHGPSGRRVREVLTAMHSYLPRPRQLHVFERRLRAGDHLTVYGTLELVDGRYRLRHTVETPLVLADRDAQTLQRDARRRASDAIVACVVITLMITAPMSLLAAFW